MYDLVIVGAGPAGISAGIYAVRRSLKTIILEKASVGGQMLLTNEIENWPGFEMISGSDLAGRMESHAKKLGVEIKTGEVIGMNLDGDVKKLTTRDGEHETKAVIIATGGQHRKLGIKGEDEFAGKGVSYCATCDAPFFKGKTVAVVGGGNIAAEDALYLSEVASKVYLVHRKDSLRAEEAIQERLKEKGVEFILNSEVEEILGENFVNSIKLKGGKTLEVNGVFISIGIVPSTTMAKAAGVELDDKGYVKVNREQETSVPGVFAAGDVTGGVMQISTAVGEGCIAALSAYKHVKKPYWG
ncbi:MAG: thioredoxin-disulfide reductase [Candidatus Altiarchaeales archaeon]|nr:thioredoxin-disulfide reductase [Candidatus Altiarchaeota archaeon]MCG2782802.1 thioredoxin-disulfide reductase [Candidatus Altiarchaeales archaeon]MBU4266741.1 thioredoxin-disulfide reductase [Candidatus Altiarchaeota archaeon]MBU4341480.1 thioredoxin-disulfide reductase [Candidatus Altiarchaeota archaeon]MBU4406257.1 thioredoxin-disulfide reductase [Candidatus Altiarchaeota archaeon]